MKVSVLFTESLCVLSFLVILATCVSAQQLSGDSAKTTKAIEVYMPDGQLISHPVKVYVTENISSDHEPRLRLLRNNADCIINSDSIINSAKNTKICDKNKNNCDFGPSVTAPNQEFVDGNHVQRIGTLMVFDLESIDIKLYQSMTRVMPELSWNESVSTTDGATNSKTKRIVALGVKTVNLGNRFAAIGWTVIIVGFILLVLFYLSKKKPLKFLTAPDGHLSLAKTQIACWTVATGFIVLSYGLIRLEIPSIPESIVALMGASLVTGGAASLKEAGNATDDATLDNDKRTLTLTDLVRLHPSDQPSLFKEKPHPTDLFSLSKAQMLFWTVLLLVLFMTKSLLHGEIWEVPWELVTLMGFSQAGYLAPKFIKPDNNPPAPESGK